MVRVLIIRSLLLNFGERFVCFYEGLWFRGLALVVGSGDCSLKLGFGIVWGGGLEKSWISD